MYQGFLHFHSYLAFLVFIALVISIILFFVKRSGNKPFTASDKRLALITLILVHLQATAGIILYFVSPTVTAAFDSGELMSDATYRFFAVEHILTMLISVVLITIGYSKSKRKTESKAKFQTLAVFYLLGLVLALLRIPWDRWLG